MASKEVLYGKGIVFLELGRLEEAMEVFSELLLRYPDFEKAWYRKGLILFSVGYYAEALEAFEQAVTENQTKIPEENNQEGSENDKAELDRKIKEESQGQIQGAARAENHEESREKSRGLEDKLNDAETEDAWMKIGLSQLKMGYYEAAFEIFGKLLEIKPEAADLWYVAGLALRGLDQDEQAIAHFHR